MYGLGTLINWMSLVETTPLELDYNLGEWRLDCHLINWPESVGSRSLGQPPSPWYISWQTKSCRSVLQSEMLEGKEAWLALAEVLWMMNWEVVAGSGLTSSSTTAPAQSVRSTGRQSFLLFLVKSNLISAVQWSYQTVSQLGGNISPISMSVGSSSCSRCGSISTILVSSY